MATYNLDGDRPFVSVSLGGNTWSIGELSAKKKDRIRLMWNAIDDDGDVLEVKDGWGRIASEVMPEFNEGRDDTYFAKATRTEVGLFAYLLADLIAGE